MKEVTIQRFEKGDFVKGKKGNGYTITNERMTRGVVTGVDENNETMTVKVLGHPWSSEIKREYRVTNSTNKFELLPKVNNKADEDHILSVAVAAEKGSNRVNAVVRYKGDAYAGLAVCSPDDVFDFRMGAVIAIGRAFDLIDACEGGL